MSESRRRRVSRGATVPAALLTGLDGVLRMRDEDATGRLEHTYGVEPGMLDATAFAPERLVPALTGQVSDTEWRLSVAAALMGELGSADRAADFVSAWSEPTGVVDEAVRDLVADVRRRGVRVVIVANATTRLETDLAVLRLRAAVDGVVSSARVGTVLPDPALLTEAARVAGVPASRCVFVDAVAEHVRVARSLGMTAHRYTGVGALRRVLAPVLRLPEQDEPNGQAPKGPGGTAEGGGGRLVV